MVEERDDISYIEHEGERLAIRMIEGTSPGLFFLPGFGSDMTGSKAAYLAKFARARGIGFVAFDYSGHGRSSGDFAKGTLTHWLSDALEVFDRTTSGPQVVVGSSMGGWLALHLALARRPLVHALIGIAAAPDFTQDLIRDQLDDAQRHTLQNIGFIETPSAYGAPMKITRALIESGESLRLLDRKIAITCPIRLLHGLRDRDVPWQTSLRLAEAVESSDVQLHLVKDGEHRLAHDGDLSLLGDLARNLLDNGKTTLGATDG